MSELKFYLSRFVRRLHWFLVVAVALSAVAVTVALTLPPAYESEVRMIVESEQIPGNLARSTVSTPAMEQLQIIEQRLMTRENLLQIARDIPSVRGQRNMTADEIVRAMRAATTITSSSGRDQATLMTVSFESEYPQMTVQVLDAYLTFILNQDAQYRSQRAGQTQDFFQLEVDRLASSLSLQSAKIVEFPTYRQFRVRNRHLLEGMAAG